VFVTYFYTKYHVSISNGKLFVSTKLKGKYIFLMTSMLLLYMLQIFTATIAARLSKVSNHTCVQ
jgi:hypothetical protein